MSNVGKMNFFFMMTTLRVPMSSTCAHGFAFYALQNITNHNKPFRVRRLSLAATSSSVLTWPGPNGWSSCFNVSGREHHSNGRDRLHWTASGAVSGARSSFGARSEPGRLGRSCRRASRRKPHGDGCGGSPRRFTRVPAVDTLDEKRDSGQPRSGYASPDNRALDAETAANGAGVRIGHRHLW